MTRSDPPPSLGEIVRIVGWTTVAVLAFLVVMSALIGHSPRP